MKLFAMIYWFVSMIRRLFRFRIYPHARAIVLAGAFCLALPVSGYAEYYAPLESGDVGVMPQQGEYHPFGKKRPKPRTDPSLQKKIDRVLSIQQKAIDSDSPLTYSGRPVEPQKDTDLAPRRSTFPGKSDTLSQMDEESPSQLNVFYKLDEQATAHVAINEQNLESPTYAPIKKDEGVNAAGMYLNVDVQDNVKLKVGGEVRSHETVSHDPSDQSSAGAQIGLQWNF